MDSKNNYGGCSCSCSCPCPCCCCCFCCSCCVFCCFCCFCCCCCCCCYCCCCCCCCCCLLSLSLLRWLLYTYTATYIFYIHYIRRPLAKGGARLEVWLLWPTCCCSGVSEALFFYLLCNVGCFGSALFLPAVQRFDTFSTCCFAWLRHESGCCSNVSEALPAAVRVFRKCSFSTCCATFRHFFYLLFRMA